MKLIVGLGNPGKEYERTRHNAGFEVMDEIARQESASISQKKFKALVDKVNIGGQSVLLMKPQTYMNNSGEAVRAAMDFYHLQPQDLLVIYDDMDLAVGRLRLRQKGSAGGHNGIKSIIDYLGTDAFPRIKVGIGGKPRPEYDLADWVLSRFTEAERREIDGAAANCLPAAEMIIKGDFEGAMAKFNG